MRFRSNYSARAKPHMCSAAVILLLVLSVQNLLTEAEAFVTILFINPIKKSKFQ